VENESIRSWRTIILRTLDGFTCIGSDQLPFDSSTPPGSRYIVPAALPALPLELCLGKPAQGSTSCLAHWTWVLCGVTEVRTSQEQREPPPPANNIVSDCCPNDTLLVRHPCEEINVGRSSRLCPLSGRRWEVSPPPWWTKLRRTPCEYMFSASALKLGHCLTGSRCLKRARLGSRGPSKLSPVYPRQPTARRQSRCSARGQLRTFLGAAVVASRRDTNRVVPRHADCRHRVRSFFRV